METIRTGNELAHILNHLEQGDPMIIATEVLFACVIALALSIIFGFMLHREIPRSGFFLFFLTVLLFTIAGGLWGRRFGPVSLGVFWLPMVMAGLIGAVFLFYRAPKSLPHNRKETLELLDQVERNRKMRRATYLTMDLTFWIILVLLVMVILAYFIKEGIV